jgi:hypothetical protein
MKKVAAYALFAKNLTPDEVKPRFQDVVTKIQNWLDRKGTIVATDNMQTFAFKDGRIGEYSSALYDVPIGQVVDHHLREPSDGLFIETQVSVAAIHDRVVVYVQLEIESDAYELGPNAGIDMRCPLIVRQLVADYPDWHLKESAISGKPFRFQGEADLAILENILWHPDRNLPVVIVSGKEEELLTPTFPEDLADELVGIALVCTIDSPLSRALTDSKGKEWSCFNGSVRLYWPDIAKRSISKQHYLWTRSSLMAHAEDDAALAAEQLMRQLRRRLMSLSAFSMPEPAVFQRVRDSFAEMANEAVRSKLRSSQDWAALAENYASENELLKKAATETAERIKQLVSVVTSLQVALQWKESSTEVEPDVELPPSTIEEAIQIAKRSYSEQLVFGQDVAVGVQSLASDAGPPDKILRYLQSLSEMTIQRRKPEGLGVDAIPWLVSRSVIASGESESVNNSSDERAKRAWHDGVRRRYFDHHLKPADGKTSDYCVRIYFDYDTTVQKCFVAWVGRHP